MTERFQVAVRMIRRGLREITPVTLLGWASGYALGALTGVFPLASVLIFGGITVIVLFWMVVSAVRSSRTMAFNAWELALRDPDADAAAALTRSNEHYLVVGQAIEYLPHPQLNSRASIQQLGWTPSEIDLKDEQVQLECEELLARAGGLRSFDPPNGTKFSVTSTSYITADSPLLSISTRRTDYFTIRSVLPLVKGDSSIRAEFGRLNPSESRIPHSLCLHFVVRFSDGNVLCMRRDSRAAYHGNLWSFSGEEQLGEKDFDYGQPCLSFFQRSFCEEVLALRDETPLDERWQIASEIVESMSVLSLFIEERIHNYSLLGLFQLRCEPDDFVQLHNRLVDRGVGSRDREGDFYVVRHAELLNLLIEGSCEATAMFASAVERLPAESLHPTSRYRLFRLCRAVNRGPLEPDLQS